MDVRCEKCQTVYEFDDARVKESGVTVKCTQCGHIFKVRKRTAEGKPRTLPGLAPLPTDGPPEPPPPAQNPRDSITSSLPPQTAPTDQPFADKVWLLRSAARPRCGASAG